MKKVKRSLKIYMLIALTAFMTLASAGWVNGQILPSEAEAAEKQVETVDLRIVGTTDLHGQLNSMDYELGVDYSNGGLARVFDLIKKTRSELPKENTVTVDAGDVLYDYTTEYIFSENQDAIQPIYQAMAKIGYDAITLGNHDFDYGYEYIQKQLNGAGLRDITVVSNVTDSKTGSYPFVENMLITRKLKTSAGNIVEVKIGIIGQTIPVLTSKTHSYTGILKGEDMVINAQNQAKKLKEAGADIIIALSHTGIGPETPELNFKNVAYALTKIPEIDVVVCGHEHNLFPTSDTTSPYYKLPNVDKKTSLMNGKNVIMAGNRGKAIGVVDLTLEVKNDEVAIADRTSEIRLVTSTNTKEEPSITNGFGSWAPKLLEYSTETIATLEAGTVIQNFYGLLGDNPAIQLLNDAKIDYVARFVNTTGKNYLGYPVVAASNYYSYGLESVDDFINIHDTLTESKLSAIQPYNNYIYIYSVTGKQLKEWLEWSASAYETTTMNQKWSDKVMAGLMQKTGLKSLIKEEWLGDWSSFYVFDGIDYVIDPSKEPRYDINGNKINNSNRLLSITYNGTEVTDDKVFLLATNKITQPNDAIAGIDKKVVLNGFVRTQSILSKYIQQISNDGSVLPQIDYNWSVSLPVGNKFLMKAPYYAKSFVEGTSWYQEYLSDTNKYSYYIASYPEKEGDNVGPHIVTTPVITSATAILYPIAVQVTDESEIKYLKYMNGDYGLDYESWKNAQNLTKENTFLVSRNGTYSIYAEDVNGNKSVYKLVIDNFSDNLLGSPIVDSYTNRKTKISGRAEPGATVVFEAYTGTYESKVEGNGKFSYALPAQPSGTAVKVFVRDNKNGAESARINVTVKRTGPNQPNVNPLCNNVGYITGYLDDIDATIIAMVDDTVYVPVNGGKELFEKNSEIYNPQYKIVETQLEVNDVGYYVFLLPPQEAGKQVTLYNIDHLSRNSRANTVTVIEAAPNAPVVYEISNIEKELNGYVPTNSKKRYDIDLTIGGKTYSTITDTAGNFSLELTEQLKENQSIIVTASEEKNGAVRISYPTEILVSSIERYIRPNSTNLTLNRVSDKSYMITGNYMDTGSLFLAITKGQGEEFQSTLITVETDDAGRFKYRLEEKLEAGMNIYAMTRFRDGRILLANKSVVIAGRPDMPSLFVKVTNADKKVQVVAKQDNEVTLTIGTKVYVTKEYQVDEVTGNCIYTFVADRALSGTVITVTASNESGISDVLSTAVVKAAPDQPTVNEIKSVDTLITGTVELVNYVLPLPEGTVTDPTTEQIPKRFKKAAPNVAKTRTRIIAQIGNETYEGTIDNEGKFKIKIPAQTEGTVVMVWGMNKAGRGPLIKVLVKK